MGQNADIIRAEADGLRVSADNLDVVADDVEVLEDGPPAAPTFVSVELSATEVEAGQSVTVLWEAQDADSVVITKDDGAVSEIGVFGPSGSFSDIPQADTTYTLTATGAGGETVATVDVTMVQPRPAPTVDALTVSPSEVEVGQEVEVAWQTTEADTVRVEFVGSVVEDLASGPADGSLIHAPSESGTYRVTVTNPEGTDSAEAAVTVTQPEGDVDLVIADQVISGHTVPAGETHEIRGTVESDANVVVLGTLKMRPGSTLRFVDVDESQFVGGGMDVLASDVGLWVMGDGVLDIQGTPRAGWVRMAPGDPPPADWQDGDEILVCPNGPGETSPDDFRTETFPAVNPPDPFILPDGTPLPTECANLTRDVVIEGTPGGRAHVLIRSTRPQTIKHCILRHLAPKLDDHQSGRYALHFHHSNNGSRGTLVEGVVARDCGGHAFVPHVSHGITMRDCVSYQTWHEPYWWDSGDRTDDVLWEHNLAALATPPPSGQGKFRLAGFHLGRGVNMTIRDSAAVGIQGLKDASGFTWPEGVGSPGTWTFENNIAHNNAVHGIFVWQNDDEQHIIRDFIAYRNGSFGIDHGAYRNLYQYVGLMLAENEKGGINSHAMSKGPQGYRGDGYGLAFEGVTITGGEVGIQTAEHAQVPRNPMLILNCSINAPVKLRIDDDDEPTQMDFVRCGIEPGDVDFIHTPNGSRFRFQRADGTAWQMDHEGNVTEIEPFYPDASTA